MPDSGKWHTEMDNPEVIKYKLGDLKEDIDEQALVEAATTIDELNEIEW